MVACGSNVMTLACQRTPSNENSTSFTFFFFLHCNRSKLNDVTQYWLLRPFVIFLFLCCLGSYWHCIGKYYFADGWIYVEMNIYFWKRLNNGISNKKLPYFLECKLLLLFFFTLLWICGGAAFLGAFQTKCKNQTAGSSCAKMKVLGYLLLVLQGLVGSSLRVESLHSVQT